MRSARCPMADEKTNAQAASPAPAPGDAAQARADEQDKQSHALSEQTERLREEVADRFVFARGAPFLPISCKTGKGVNRLLPEADALAQRFATQMSTGELNRLLNKAYEAQEPRGKSGKRLKIRYAVQVASNPPLIRLFADRAEPLHFSFERYLQNRIREKWKLAGVPLKFVVKPGA